MTTADVLKAARKLIEVPERWTKDAAGRLSDGTPAASCDDRTVCWCAMGAVKRANISATGGDHYGGPYQEAMDALRRQSRREDVVIYNDDPLTTHADILALFDRAIADLEGREDAC